MKVVINFHIMRGQMQPGHVHALFIVWKPLPLLPGVSSIILGRFAGLENDCSRRCAVVIREGSQKEVQITWIVCIGLAVWSRGTCCDQYVCRI